MNAALSGGTVDNLDDCGCPMVHGVDPVFPDGEWTEHRKGCPQVEAWLSTMPEQTNRQP